MSMNLTNVCVVIVVISAWSHESYPDTYPNIFVSR